MKKDKAPEKEDTAKKTVNSNIEKPIIEKEKVLEPKKKLSSVSIKNTLQQVSEIKPNALVTSMDAVTRVEEPIKESFDIQSLKDALALFVKIKRFHERVKCVLLSNEPEIKGETIVLGLDNVIQESDFQKLKPMVLSFLKKELKNDHINLKAIVLKGKTTKKTFTDTERFNSLCKKNPALRSLKELLSLDFE